MITLSPAQYEAIGRIAVESGVLEREIEEYLEALGAARRAARNEGIGPKLGRLIAETAKRADTKGRSSSLTEVLGRLAALIEARNAAVHGVWSAPSNAPLVIGEASVAGRSRAFHAREATHIATSLRLGRKTLLGLMHDIVPAAAGSKPRPAAKSEALYRRFLAGLPEDFRAADK
jgi:hypothetical protein